MAESQARKRGRTTARRTRREPDDVRPHPHEITIPLRVLQDRRLTSTAKVLYGVVRSFAMARRNHYNPTLHEISMRSNIGAVVVIRTITNLVQAGYVRKHKDHGGRRNRYEFLK